MDIARHTPTRQNWPIQEFLRLGVEQREELRHELECPECEALAFYRRASRSGQSACFGARHEDGCHMAAPVAERVEDGAGADENALENLGQHIVLDIAFGAAERVNPDLADEVPEGQGRARRFVGRGDRPEARNHRRLTPLLRSLIAHPELAESDIAIEPPGLPARPAREFFVRFEQMAQHRNETHGIWGVVDNAAARGDLYLNCGNNTMPTILVPSAMKDVIYLRYGIDRARLLQGAHVLIVGSPFSNRNGKTFCVPETVAHIALIRA